MATPESNALKLAAVPLGRLDRARSQWCCQTICARTSSVLDEVADLEEEAFHFTQPDNVIQMPTLFLRDALCQPIYMLAHSAGIALHDRLWPTHGARTMLFSSFQHFLSSGCLGATGRLNCFVLGRAALVLHNILHTLQPQTRMSTRGDSNQRRSGLQAQADADRRSNVANSYLFSRSRQKRQRQRWNNHKHQPAQNVWREQ